MKNEGKKFSLCDRIKSFKYAFAGLWFIFKSTHNAWIHVSAAVLVVVLGFYFSIGNYEWIALTLVIGFVMVSEAINTAIERLVDLTSPEWNEKAGRIKDMAAGAVLIAAFIAVVVALLVFIPHLL